MIVDRVQLQNLKHNGYTETLGMLEIGQSIYCTELKQAQSLRSLSYYLIRSRNLDWKFTFRKMDRGWRIIRIV